MQNMNMNFISLKNQTNNLSNYTKNVTAGNDPTISNSVLYSQIVRNTHHYKLSSLILPTLRLQNIDISGNKPVIFKISAQSNSDGFITYTSSDVNTLLFQGSIGIAFKPGQVTITARQDNTSIYFPASTTAIATIT